jgi:hypothetical protein
MTAEGRPVELDGQFGRAALRSIWSPLSPLAGDLQRDRHRPLRLRDP